MWMKNKFSNRQLKKHKIIEKFPNLTVLVGLKHKPFFIN